MGTLALHGSRALSHLSLVTGVATLPHGACPSSHFSAHPTPASPTTMMI